MKRIKEPDYVANSELVMEAVDFRASTVAVPCPCCSREIYLPEAYISWKQAYEIECLISELNAGIRLAYEETYGGDPRVAMLLSKIAERLQEARRPKLKVVKG